MKFYIRSTQSIFAGTRYDKQAAKILVDSGMYNEEQANTIIDALFHQDLHAFVHAPAWLEKYLKGIARICVEEAHGSQQTMSQFIEGSVYTFDKFLSYVKENRDKLGGAAFDSKFNTSMHYQDVVNMMDAIQAELDKQSAEELAKMQKDSSSNFTLVPINSFQEFNEKFGGHWTGDGSSDKYAGGGGTAWCHANSNSTYESWRRRGKFYVLADKNFKEIPFNRESNSENPKDAYGNSLIALLVDTKTGKLLNATLRCNHVGVPTNADNQYKTYAELSKIAGFNVQELINADLENYLVERPIKSVALDKAKFEIGDRISVTLGVYGTFTATAVMRQPDYALFVYDTTVARGVFADVPSILEDLTANLPAELTGRTNLHRLLQASEVFSDCDDPFEWTWLEEHGVEMQRPQIPYFSIADHRKSEDGHRWWLNTPIFYLDEDRIVACDNDGECLAISKDHSRFIRPAFAVHDIE